MRVALTHEGDIVIADGNGGLRLLREDWSHVETLVPPSGSGGGGVCAGGHVKHRDGPLDRARMSTCDGLVEILKPQLIPLNLL
jgi:hypothetical protein